MKIDYLKINSKFKNLNGVTIEFDEENLMTVVIGRNGSGKSNVIEAIVSIFRNLDLAESPIFDYEILYSLKGELEEEPSLRWIKVEANQQWGDTPAKQYRISEKVSTDLLGNEEWKSVPLSAVMRDKVGQAQYLPRYVFAYYSGPSDRLEKYFRTHRTNFYKNLLNNRLALSGEIRPLFYAKPIHSQFVLLAFFLAGSDSRERRFLEDHLGIYDLDSVHFVLRKPGWTKAASKKELFWGASGTVRTFLELIFPQAIGPLKITRQEDVSLTGSAVKNEFFHLFLPDIKALRALASGLTDDALFKMLESILLSELLSEVRIRVRKHGSSVPLSFSELSEGEQQLLTVLGLLKFTGGRDSLFLLDEPDTHLNPSWTVDYISFLRKFVPNQSTSHLILVTHHPLAIAELSKKQVQVMWQDNNYQVHVKPPEFDPKGMGFEGILTSDMFGLGSSLDKATTKQLLRLHKLSTKENLSKPEAAELNELREDLARLDFNFASTDRLEREFVRARFDLFESGEFEGPIVTKDNKEQAVRALVHCLLQSLRKGDEK